MFPKRSLNVPYLLLAGRGQHEEEEAGEAEAHPEEGEEGPDQGGGGQERSALRSLAAPQRPAGIRGEALRTHQGGETTCEEY
eukprot:1191789-Prorocentrum_minimum.AAC.1